MKRRTFITLFGGAATSVVLPRASRAQETVPLIGLLSTLDALDPGVATFTKAMSALGWTEGRNLQIAYRFAGGDAAVRGRFAAELVALDPKVIFVGGSGGTEALLRATRSIPVVFVQVSDPAEAGFVASLARPGGNATGFTNFETSITTKWLEIIKRIRPGISRVAVLRDPSVANGAAQLAAVRAALLAFGVEISPMDVRDLGGLERDLAAFAQLPNGGMVVLASAMGFFHQDQIVAIAAKLRLPAVYPDRAYVVAGGMISYAPDRNEQYRRAAAYVDRILRGEKPADLPVQNPTRYELLINLKTAKALGFDIPISLLSLADEVIE